MMNQPMCLYFLLGALFTGSAVVADDVNHTAIGNKTPVDAWRVPSIQPQASAMDAASATTLTNHITGAAAATNTLPLLPPGVSELKFNEFFRQPIGPRGLEYTEKLRSLDGRWIRILGYMARQSAPLDRCFLPLTLYECESRAA